MLAIPVTSAPEAKNRPSPVMTVKVVSGWLSNSRRAAIVSSTRLPPKELSCLGLLSCVYESNILAVGFISREIWISLASVRYEQVTYLDGAYAVLNRDDDV